jgi:hypothetical protein
MLTCLQSKRKLNFLMVMITQTPNSTDSQVNVHNPHYLLRLFFLLLEREDGWVGQEGRRGGNRVVE